jgi:hypothetical protein
MSRTLRPPAALAMLALIVAGCSSARSTVGQTNSGRSVPGTVATRKSFS